MMGKKSVSIKSMNRSKDIVSLHQGLQLTFVTIVALAGAFLLGRMAAELVVGQLLPVFSQVSTAEQTAGLLLMGLAALLVLVRLDHGCGIWHAFQTALDWLQRGEVAEDG